MRTGVWVEMLAARRGVVFEQLSAEPFQPASTIKLVTTAAAMTVLPSDFTYRTVLARRGDDLLVIGSGDPSIGDPKMAHEAAEAITAVFHRWAQKLKAAGLTTIRGDLVFDDSCFEQQHLHPRWIEQFKGQMQSWWAAPVGGLNFNDNCVDLVIKPGPALGQLAEVTLIPNTSWVKLENHTKTATKGEPLVSRLGTGPITISVTGPVSKPNDPDNPLSLTVVDPGAFFASTLRTVLAADDIKINGQTRRERVRLANGELPPDVQVIAVHETPLADLLWRLNKSSQNLFAEALFKTIGAHPGRGRPEQVGGYETARPVVEEFLKSIGASLENCVLDDGSGLSHSNRVTPAMMGAILRFMDHHPHRDRWLASLAEPGEREGTLRKRMRDLRGRVFAKTGHLSGVSALCGYVLGPHDYRWAFVVLCNDTEKAKGGGANQLQDALCRTLATWPGEPVAAGQ